MRRRRIYLFLNWIILLMITSCVKGYSTVLKDTSCNHPCWMNIHPGVTTVDDAIQILEDTADVHFPQSFSETDFQSEDGHFSWLFSRKVIETSGSIHFQDDLVTKIEFVTEKIQLGDLVEKLGDPDEFLAVSGWAETKWLNVYLLYPSNGVIITYFNPNIIRTSKGKFDLTEDLKVFSILYFDPEIFDDVLIADVLNRSIGDNESLINNIQDWQGFGQINYYDLQ